MIASFNWGTRVYLPPESLQNSIVFGKALDIWALGCTLYQMVYGKHPFYTNQQKKKDLEKSIIEDEYVSLTTPDFARVNFTDSAQGRDIPSECIHLMTLMFAKLPEKRVNISQVLSHPFLRDFSGDQTSPKLSIDWRKAFSNSLIKRIN